MDEVVRVFFAQEFKLAFYLKKRTEFEDWFAEIMELRYPEDFKRVRPWGNSGDRKNDGYLQSKRMMFQVYAPNELEERYTLIKIEEDYSGAVQFWEQYFDKWVFVHNSRDGLSPKVNQKLLDLNSQSRFSVEQWGFPQLHREVFEMDQNLLRRLFRPPPAIADLYNITYSNLKNVLQYVAKKPLLDSGKKEEEVPHGKLDSNGLSDDSKQLLLDGNRKSKYVGEFFDSWNDPAYGDQVSNAFKQEYHRLKSENVPTDEILTRLLVFAGFREVTDASDIMAVYALTAYFFWVCDIFETPIEDWSHDTANETP